MSMKLKASKSQMTVHVKEALTTILQWVVAGYSPHRQLNQTSRNVNHQGHWCTPLGSIGRPPLATHNGDQTHRK